MAAVNNSEPRRLRQVQRGGVVFKRHRTYLFTYAGHKTAGRQIKPKLYAGTVGHIWITTKGERCINVQLIDGTYRTFYVYGVFSPAEIVIKKTA